MSELPECHFGSDCYRKNPDHRKKFRHPVTPVTLSKKAKVEQIYQSPFTKRSKRKRDDLNSIVELNSTKHSSSICSSDDNKANDQRAVKKLQTTEKKFLTKDSDEPSAIPDSPLKKTSNKLRQKQTQQCEEIIIDEPDEKVIESQVLDETKDELTSKLPNLELKFTETVGEILKNMPKDFFDFWDFCTSLNKSKPEEAFSELGLHLVGIYDLLSKKVSHDKVVNLHCHWRYFYDPPEFQTVVKLDGAELYHIGYFRDDPDKLPSILASNSAKTGPKLSLKGDNIFAAMNFEISNAIKKSKNQKFNKFSKIQEQLKTYAIKNRYSIDIQTNKTKARSKKVVTKTFHELGIVVPLKNDVGYRPLPDSDATVKTILKKIVSAKTEAKKLEEEENLDELISNIQFANDECDYGMGLELGLDLFCFGNTYFHSHILHILPMAYDLLKRPKYAEIVKAHLANRRKSDKLDTLDN